MSTDATLPTFESARIFAERARAVVRAHVRQVGTAAGHLADRARATAGQVADHARAYAGRLGAVAERYVGDKIKRRVQPPIVTALVIAGAALALAIIAVAIRRG